MKKIPSKATWTMAVFAERGMGVRVESQVEHQQLGPNEVRDLEAFMELPDLLLRPPLCDPSWI